MSENKEVKKFWASLELIDFRHVIVMY